MPTTYLHGNAISVSGNTGKEQVQGLLTLLALTPGACLGFALTGGPIGAIIGGFGLLIGVAFGIGSSR